MEKARKTFSVVLTPDEDKTDWSPARALGDAFLDGLKAFRSKFFGELEEFRLQAPKTVVFRIGLPVRFLSWIRFKVTVEMIAEFLDHLIPD